MPSALDSAGECHLSGQSLGARGCRKAGHSLQEEMESHHIQRWTGLREALTGTLWFQEASCLGECQPSP